MKISITSLAAALSAFASMAALAQSRMSDAEYCRVLSDKYDTYVNSMAYGMSPTPGAIDGRVAIEQCKAGDSAAAIPVLERKLQNAKIGLPPRG